jgi:hypothetical protein
MWMTLIPAAMAFSRSSSSVPDPPCRVSRAMLRSWGLLHAGITASKPAILARAVGYQTKPQQILSRHPECVDPHDGGRDQIKGVLSP